MPFNRWQCAWPRSWPYVIFKKHHTELNNLYWSSAATHSQIIGTAASAEPNATTPTVFQIPASNRRRMDFKIKDWNVYFREFSNWTRLGALMSLTGYLETYISSICRLALMSDPGVLLMSTRSVDGVKLLKKTRELDLDLHLTHLTKGDWSGRRSAYARLFGSVPNVVSANLGELEQMRKLRNGVGHSFGRLIADYRDPLLRQVKPLQRLSEARLQRWLGIVDDCVGAVEKQLRQDHVGAFEIVWSYHEWDKSYHKGHVREAKAFRATVPHGQGAPPSEEYFQEVIDYYNTI